MKSKRFCGVIAAVVLCVVTVAALASCSHMEKDISYDPETDYGLYWFGNDYSQQFDIKRSSDNLGVEYFDSARPTIVYFHGWKPEAAQAAYAGFLVEPMNRTAAVTNRGFEDVDYVRVYKEAGYNVCAFGYFQYAKDLNKLFKYIWLNFDEEGHSLACLFSRELAAMLKGYEGDVRFIGHSFGAQSAVATAYLLYKMADADIIDKSALPSRLTLADPYIAGITGSVEGSIENLNEKTAGRNDAAITADALEYLNGKNVAADVYCGMPMAYEMYGDCEAATKAEITAKLKNNTCWTVMAGLQKQYGTIGDIHTITRDWVMTSLFGDTFTLADGSPAPSAACSDAVIRSLIGKSFLQRGTFDLSDNYFEPA